MNTVVQQHLDALQQWLGTSAGGLMQTALAIETPNTLSPEWQRFLETFGVSPLSDEERASTIKIAQNVRGAALQEVSEVASRITTTGEAELEKIRQMMFDTDSGDPDADAQDRQWERLRSLVQRLREEIVAKYKSIVIPKVSMFARAKAAAAQQKGPAPKPATSAFVLNCRNCGAPRLSEQEFVCDFCGAKLG